MQSTQVVFMKGSRKLIFYKPGKRTAVCGPQIKSDTSRATGLLITTGNTGDWVGWITFIRFCSAGLPAGARLGLRSSVPLIHRYESRGPLVRFLPHTCTEILKKQAPTILLHSRTRPRRIRYDVFVGQRLSQSGVRSGTRTWTWTRTSVRHRGEGKEVRISGVDVPQ